jgi:PIN domain nuclease of toxin-antitoxin system
VECLSDETSSPIIYILDACALLSFLLREPGAAIVDELLASENASCHAHVVNLCEVYYDLVRSQDASMASQAIEDLLTAGVVARADLDTAFWQQLGDLKVNPGKLSLADCFALALALRLGATLVTSDHHEFDAVASSGLIRVLFIR